MTFYADLSTETMIACGSRVCAIGRLDSQHPYPTGPVPSHFRDVLDVMVKEPYGLVLILGVHECELCEGEPYMESRNLLVPAADVLFIAPAMITHYIDVHEYKPPVEFIDAVIACPPQQSPQFKMAMEPFEEYFNV